MRNVQHIIGADLSKRSIDLVCHLLKSHIQIENSRQGFDQLLKWLQQQQVNPSKIMIVMEHTGLYSFCFEDFLHKHHIAFTKVNALAIKRSLGLVRGKSDKLDAVRIAAYGYEKQEKLKANESMSDELKSLQMLHSTRRRLVKQRAALICAVKEYRHIGISEKDLILQSQLSLIKAYDKQIKKLEQNTEAVLKNQEQLHHNFELLKSVKGVGKVLSLTTIIKTQNFTRFTQSRKFACHCGIAPFEHSSGTSIKARSRVSHLADKEMKTLLDLAAKTAIQHDKELREFYKRRIKDGKSKMATINIVRNKILYRMFAVIKRQSPFVENYLQAA
jgi:transposase